MVPPPLFKKAPEREPPPPEEWPRGSVELDERSFDDFVDRYPVSMVEFWASWCGPCKAMRPIIRDLAGANRGKVAVGKVNIERHRKLAERVDGMASPPGVDFREGRKVDSSPGKLHRRTLEGKVKALARKYG